jgi:hypothetical protein
VGRDAEAEQAAICGHFGMTLAGRCRSHGLSAPNLSE